LELAWEMFKINGTWYEGINELISSVIMWFFVLTSIYESTHYIDTEVI